MRLDRILPFLTFLGFSLVILLFLAMNQKPLCIDSRVVERMDRVHSEGTETVYRCQVQRRVPYSQFWNESNLSQRISGVERFLEGIEPFKRKYQISILPESPSIYRIRGSQVFVGEKLALTPGQIERLLISLWVYEKAQADLERPDLALETFTDFVMSLFQGEIINPVNQLPLEKALASWPVILKSPKGYCEGAWSAPHHYQFCEELLASDLEPTSKNFVALSLRPYIFSQLQSSYQKLSLRQKNLIYKNIAKILRALDLRHPDLFFQNHISDLVGSQRTVHSIGDQIFRAGQVLGMSEIQSWGSYYKLEIARDFQSQQSAQASVDYIFDFSTLSQQALQMRISEINPWIQRNPKVKVAVIGADEIYFLPDKSGVSLAQFGQLNARYRMIEACQDIEVHHLFEIEDLTENLSVVQNCQDQKQPKYQAFLRGGAVDFAIANKKINFVDLHIPSFMSRKSEILQLSFLFSSLRGQKSEFSKIFIWTDLVFDDSLEVYSPQAGIEGIRHFRVHHAY